MLALGKMGSSRSRMRSRTGEKGKCRGMMSMTPDDFLTCRYARTSDQYKWTTVRKRKESALTLKLRNQQETLHQRSSPRLSHGVGGIFGMLEIQWERNPIVGQHLVRRRAQAEAFPRVSAISKSKDCRPNGCKRIVHVFFAATTVLAGNIHVLKIIKTLN